MTKNIFKTTIIALGASVSIITLPLANTLPKVEVLDYVPANTAIFSGMLNPFPIKEYLSSIDSAMLMGGDVSAFDKMINDDDTEQTGKFVLSIYKSYIESIKNPTDLIKNFGLGDDIRSFTYLVDFIPVVKYEAVRPDAIWEILAKAEADSGIKGVKQSLNGVDYTSYTLGDDERFELIVSTNDKWVTISIKVPKSKVDNLDIILGNKKPENPISSTNILQDIVDEYAINGSQIGFINHKRILSAITSKTPIHYIPQDKWDDMKEIQTAACQADFAKIADNFPRTIVGSGDYKISEMGYSEKAKLVVEIKNDAINDALIGLRGHLPNYANSSVGQLVSLALGLDVNNLTNSLNKLWTLTTNADYSCEPLLDMQANLKETNPMMLGMFTGMARGVSGVSASVFEADIDFKHKNPKFNMLDALLTLSAENPAAQFATLGMVNPGFRGVNLPTDGSEIGLNKHFPPLNALNGEVKASVQGKYLNVYQGDKARAMSMGTKKDTLDKNGVFGMFMDYGPVFKIINKAIIASGEPLPMGYENYENLNMKFSMDMDFTKKGVEMDFAVDLKK